MEMKKRWDERKEVGKLVKLFVTIVGRRTSTLKVIYCIVDWIGSVLDVLSGNDTMLMLVAKLVKVLAPIWCVAERHWYNPRLIQCFFIQVGF